MNPTQMNTEVAAVAALVEQSAMPRIELHDALAVPVLLHRDGSAKSLEHLLASPIRARAKATFTDADSFCIYVNRHRQPGTLCTMSECANGATLQAIIDYHPPYSLSARPEPNTTGRQATNWGEHTAQANVNFAEEWLRWTAANERLLSQAEMAQHIEDSVDDITAPAPSEMLEIVKTMEATQNVEFKSALRLDNGDRDFLFTEKTGARAGANGSLTIPAGFTLEIPVLENQAPQKVNCRLRWRIKDGALAIGYKIMDRNTVVQCALDNLRAEVGSKIGLPVLLGTATVVR